MLSQVWRGAIGRKFLKRLHAKATKIAAQFRAHLVRCTLDKDGKRVSGKAMAERRLLQKQSAARDRREKRAAEGGRIVLARFDARTFSSSGSVYSIL